MLGPFADMGSMRPGKHAPTTAEDGARSIAWNVEHKQPADINGKFYRYGAEVDAADTQAILRSNANKGGD